MCDRNGLRGPQFGSPESDDDRCCALRSTLDLWPVSDLLLGCGLGYAAFIALVALLSIDLGAMAVFGSIATLLIGAPRYGAALLRV